MRSRKPKNARLEREFPPAVKARDGFLCRMERWNGREYVEHGIKGSPLNPLEASHIYARSAIAAPIQFDPVVAITSCADCHVAYGKRDDAVRVPPAYELRAWRALNLAIRKNELKKLPPRREPPAQPLKGIA